MKRRRTKGSLLVMVAGAVALMLPGGAARAVNQLTILAPPVLDRPTLIALGVQLLISGDDNHNASVAVRYRKSGDLGWRQGLPLFRVHPENVTGLTVPEQFAGSIFNLRPATTYEVELTAHDPDGPADQVRTLTATTRSIPADPPSPRTVNVSNVSGLSSALNAAAGDVILLANGTYSGTFSMTSTGTAQNPVVIRGQSEDGVILNGGGAGGNVLEVYGSFVHVENLTLQNANRALRFQTAGAQGHVVRRVHIKNVVLGIGSNANQKDSYICDNNVEGRLVWPSVYADDGGLHANDDGIHVEGDGHVVCHNQIIGFGDALKIEQDGSRANDFYGNEVLSAYDNDIELDTTAGNGRCLFNRFTNGYMPISFQPIFGGPAYALRNVVVNVTSEQMKFHNETSGILVYHNTFVSTSQALAVMDDTTSHHFTISNNLFIGPASPSGGRTVSWDGFVDDGTFDYNGYLPNAGFMINFSSGKLSVANFAAWQAAGVEVHGLVMSGSPFASGLTPPASYTVTMVPQDVTLAAGSSPIDRGLVLPNVNDGFKGNGPDLGALERGCPSPVFGIRPQGTDESNEPFGCEPSNVQPDQDGGNGDGVNTDAGSGGETGGAGGSAGSGGGGMGGAAGAGGAGGSGGRVDGGTGGSGGAAEEPDGAADDGGGGNGRDGGTDADGPGAGKGGGCACSLNAIQTPGAGTAGLALSLVLLFVGLSRSKRAAKQWRMREELDR